MVKIERIIEGSLAALVGINENDMLISINGHEIADVLDYRFYLAEKRVDIKVMRDTELNFVIEKELYEDIGLEFETPLMDKKHRCENKCIFCFIDQLPKGLRKSRPMSSYSLLTILKCCSTFSLKMQISSVLLAR